jgi:hypothetical protein
MLPVLPVTGTFVLSLISYAIYRTIYRAAACVAYPRHLVAQPNVILYPQNHLSHAFASNPSLAAELMAEAAVLASNTSRTAEVGTVEQAVGDVNVGHVTGTAGASLP